jgi:hypothetical protein
MSNGITVNAAQSLFVIPCGDGHTCFGFENARKHAEQIATALNRSDLMPTPEVFGTLAGYALYEQAVRAFASSVLSAKTYFDPGTDPLVQRVLERYRESVKRVRVFFGDPETGRDWCEEWDVVGTIGRSGGTMKSPLLVPHGENIGPAISTSKVLRVMDVGTNKEVYRHPMYKVPALEIEPLDDPELPKYKWAGFRDGELIARFYSNYQAAEWKEFMIGGIATKREDLLKLAA